MGSSGSKSPVTSTMPRQSQMNTPIKDPVNSRMGAETVHTANNVNSVKIEEDSSDSEDERGGTKQKSSSSNQELGYPNAGVTNQVRE